MLHCTHHICASHMEQLVNSSTGLLPCPVCGDVTAMPESGLALDRSLQLVQSFWQEREARPKAVVASGEGKKTVPMCGFCEEQPASRRCVQCDGVLCEACLATSHSKGFFKSHQIIDFEDAPGADFDLTSKMICDIHPQEKLSFYCLDCRMPVCSHCLILGEHKGHQQKHIEEAYDTGKDTLNAWVEKLMQRIDSCEDILGKLRAAEIDVNQGATAQRDIINHEMDHLKELIETKRHQLLSKSALEEKQKRVQLQAQNERTTEARAMAQNMINRSEDLLAVGSEHAFLAVVLPLIQDMKKVCTQPPEPAPHVTGNFRPLMTDSQVRIIGDLDLGVQAKPAPTVQISPQVATPMQANVLHASLGGHSVQGYQQNSGMTHVNGASGSVSYLSASSTAQQTKQQSAVSAYQSGPQVIYRAAMPAQAH